MQYKVLICDDVADLLEVCTIILEKAGYLVQTKTHCNDLVSYVLEFKPHVILLDLRMPGIGGDEAIVLLKDNPSTKNIPVIFFTANSNIANLPISSRADGYIEKPFDIHKLLDTVKQKISQSV